MLTQSLLSIALLSTEWIIGMLLFLSVLSLAIIIERLIVLNSKWAGLRKFQNAVKALIRKGSAEDVEREIGDSTSSGARVTMRTVEHMREGKLSFDDSLEIALSEEKIDLERRIAVLGTLGNNAPFIGLLGTVLGIINAFHSLSQRVQGGPSVILKGISEALVATALGLFIAIPAVVAYNYFVRKVRKILVHSESAARMAVPILMKK
jgi:biopolymer transport protein ExbB/TolQ